MSASFPSALFGVLGLAAIRLRMRGSLTVSNLRLVTVSSVLRDGAGEIIFRGVCQAGAALLPRQARGHTYRSRSV